MAGGRGLHTSGGQHGSCMEEWRSRRPSAERTPEESVEADEPGEALASAIGKLSSAEQRGVLLSHMGGRSRAEVAAFLEITPNAMKT